MMSPDTAGNVLPTTRTPVAVGLLALLLLIVGLGTWATQAMIDGAVVAPGRVIVESSRQAVQHPDGGVVAEVLVREGSAVRRGDVLVRLDPTMARSELEIVESQLFELMARRGRLEAERDGATDITFDPDLRAAAEASEAIAELVRGQELLFEARLESFNQSVVQLRNQELQLKNQVIGIDAVSTALGDQIALTRQELTGQESLLQKGLAQGSRVLNLRRELARLSGSIGEATAQRAEALERNAEIEIEIAQRSGQRREEAITTLRDLKISEIELSERRKSIRTRLDRMEIRAPSAGVVYDTRLIGEWSVIRPAEPILFILPDDRPLLIEVRMSPLHISSVHAGQKVVVRFPSFDMRETPDLLARVRQVSPDVIADAATGESYYRVEVELPKEELDKLAEGQVVVPGMPAQTFLQTGEYTPLTYLLKPLARYMSTAMREGS